MRDAQMKGGRAKSRRGRRGAQTTTGAFRLTTRIRPTAYALSVEVDPTRSRRYRGTVAIDIELAKATEAITLHAADLTVRGARLELAGRVLRGRIEARPDDEAIVVQFAARVPAGKARLHLRFSGSLRDDLRGLYLARSGARRYAFTQLEAADARRFFPCFDEPAFKARFTLEVTTARAHAVVSNAAIENTERLAGGKKRVRFATTPLLSSYLLALAVGDLRASREIRAGATPIRVWHVPGKRRLTGFALDCAARCLRELERYFGVRYPYGKLDLVAVPDFEIGAMENAGAVFFRETLLLLDERSATLPEQKRASEVICHELAHMWFGNLVTMAWWDDLWLNEAFATWMAFEIVDGLRPDLRMWNDFGAFRDTAFELDALRSTHPVYTTVRTAAEATENFDAITYEKGAAVVRMIQRYLGPARFRRGVRRYIRRHREANARATDLWHALSQEAGEAIEEVVRPWVERAGFPMVRLRMRGDRLSLTQEQFRATGPSRAKAVPWPIPLRVRHGQSTRRLLMARSSAQLALGRSRAPVYGNADESGFYRPLHAPDLLRRLVGTPERLQAAERLGLVSHQWAMAAAGYAPLGDFMEVVDAFTGELDPDVMTAMISPLGELALEIAPAGGTRLRGTFRRFVSEAFAPAWAAVGWRTKRTESLPERLRRALLAHIMSLIAEQEQACAHAEALAEQHLARPSSIEPNLATVVVTVGARRGDRTRHARYLRASRTAQTPQQQRRFRMALADFRAPVLIDRTLALCLSSAIPTQDVPLVLARLLQNPAATRTTWRFIKRQWPTLKSRMPQMLVTRVIDATPALGDERYRRDVARFFARHPVPTAARALRLADERFVAAAALRTRGARELADWLRARE